MTIGEYFILFAGILVGLAIADLAFSLHKLLRAGRSIRWTPLVPLLAFIVLCLILNIWWSTFNSYTRLEEISFLRFLPEVASLLLLFLLSASVLPDDRLPPGSDLAAFHADNRPQFWGLFAAYLAAVIGGNTLKGIERNLDFDDIAQSAVVNGIALLMALAAIRIKRMWYDYLLAAFWLALIAYFWFGSTLRSAS